MIARLNRYKNHLVKISLYGLLFFIAISAINDLSNNSNVNYNVIHLGAAVMLYIFAQVIRSARLWLVLIKSKITFMRVTSSLFLSYSIGNFLLPVFIKDILLIFFIGIKDWLMTIKILLALIYVRIFDLIVLTILTLTMHDFITFNVKYILIALFTVSLVFIIFLISGNALCKSIKNYAISNINFRYSFFIVKTFAKLEAIFTALDFYKIQKLLLVAMLTLFCWIIELSAILILLDNNTLEELSNIVLGRINNIVLGNKDFHQYYNLLYCALIWMTIITFTICKIYENLNFKYRNSK